MIDEQKLFEMGTRAPARGNRSPEDVIRRGRRYGRRRRAAQAGGALALTAMLAAVAGSLTEGDRREAVVAAAPDGSAGTVPAGSPSGTPSGNECLPHQPAGGGTETVYGTPEAAVDAFRQESTAPHTRWEPSTGGEQVPEGSRLYVNRELAGDNIPEPVALLVSPKGGGWTITVWQRTDC